MAIPIAREDPTGVIGALLRQERGKLRIGGFDLFPGRIAVVRQEIASVQADGDIDQRAEGRRATG